MNDHLFESGRCFVVCEVGQAHDGSLGSAHAFIDAAAKAGADAVKFQTHLAAEESTAAEPWRVPLTAQDETRFAYWRRMEFSEDQWRGLANHAAERRLAFLSSVFSIEAAMLVERLGVAAWKVASGEVNHGPLLQFMAKTGRPLLVSTGVSPLSELDLIVERLKKENVRFALLQCTTMYPCPPEKVGLNVMSLFRKRYNCPVGLSDHSGTIFPALASAAIGLDVLEVHLTLSRDMFGPDVPASVTTNEMAQLIRGVRFIEKMRDNPVDKDLMADELRSTRSLFTHSVVARVSLPAGSVLAADSLALKKPGTGFPPDRFPDLVGRRLRRKLEADDLIAEDDLES